MIASRRLLKKMFDVVEAQKRDINQLYVVSQKTISELCRANNYAAQAEGVLHKLDALLGVYEGLRKGVPEMSDSEKQGYVRLLNDIATEVQFLKAVLAAGDENLKKLKASGDIEGSVRGSILGLGKEADKLLKKVEKILEGT